MAGALVEQPPAWHRKGYFPCKGIGAGDALPADEDLRDQRAVLRHVLALHPDHLTIPELVREMTAGSEDFAAHDSIERAVRDLTGIGLVHCPGGTVMPTRAAVHFDRLDRV